MARRKRHRKQQQWPMITLGEVIAEHNFGICPPGYKLVYVNGNGLDCTDENLRYVPEDEDWLEPKEVAAFDGFA